MQLGARLDAWVLHAAWRFLLIPAAMAGAWWWNERRLAQARKDGELEDALLFENAAPVVVTQLDLFEG
jgi:hypothetical protein